MSENDRVDIHPVILIVLFFDFDYPLRENLATVKKTAVPAAATRASTPGMLLSPVLGVVSGVPVGATVTTGVLVGALVATGVLVGLGVGVAVGLGVLVGTGVAVGAGVGVLVLATAATVGVGVGVVSLFSLLPHAATAITFITKRADRTSSIILLFILFLIPFCLLSMAYTAIVTFYPHIGNSATPA